MKLYRLILQTNDYNLNWGLEYTTELGDTAATNVAEFWARKFSQIDTFRCIVVFDLSSNKCLGECYLVVDKRFEWRERRE